MNLFKKSKPSKIIFEASENLNVDLIVIGKSSKGKIAIYLLGSTAAYIVNHARVSILVLP